LLGLLAELDDMPGTADELERLRKLVPGQSTFLSNAAATESALRTLPRPPGVLHLGCHAFFLPGTAGSGAPLDFDENAELLFSGGLLLHRAALRRPEAPALSPDDDLLYPSEVAALPLRGTRLVTLSSCESGAGTAVSGEGLLGLRRGFALAGAREVLVALWPVSDRSTPEFMERFYRLALASGRTGQALWQCQREFLSGVKDDDEFEAAVLRYAPFVLSQNEPLATGGEIVVKEKRKIPWHFAWLLAPLLVFLATRFAAGKKVA
jgi:CHAT domain-containing protein